MADEQTANDADGFLADYADAVDLYGEENTVVSRVEGIARVTIFEYRWRVPDEVVAEVIARGGYLAGRLETL